MDLRKLKKLIDLVQDSGIAELEITEGEEKVKIVKGGEATVIPLPASAATAARQATSAAPATFWTARTTSSAFFLSIARSSP